MRAILTGTALAVFVVTPVLADYYIVQEPSTHHCRIVEERPAPSVGVVIVGLVARTMLPVPVVPDVNVAPEIDGEIRVGLLLRTTDPVPVEVVVPVPPLETLIASLIHAP